MTGTHTLRLMAASVARMPGSVVEQLLAMRGNIKRYNEARGLSTALLYSAGWILQWHEGPPAAVEKTWSISRTHTTHQHARVIHRSIGARSLDGPLHIAALHNHDKVTDVARRLFELEKEHGHRPQEPAEIWRRFSAPAAPGQRVLAVVSDWTESVELVKSLAERCHARMAYQRFAEGDVRMGDLGAAYVDLASPLLAKVHALTRLVLSHAIVRLAFARLDGLVLLLGEQPRHAALLAHAVAGFLRGVEGLPPVWLVAPTGEVCDIAAQALAPLKVGPVRCVALQTKGRNAGDAVLELIAGLPPVR